MHRTLTQHPTGLLIRKRFATRGLDGFVADEVIRDDTYRLQDLRNIRTSIDVGAHIGAFAYALRQRFPDVLQACVEMDSRNAVVLRQNAPWAKVTQAACYYGTNRVRFVRSVLSGAHNTGDNAVAEGGVPLEHLQASIDASPTRHAIDYVATVTIEDLIPCHHIDLLKLDCEGSEYNILANCDLSRIGVIVGEWHDPEKWAQFVSRKFREEWRYEVLSTDGALGVFRLMRHADLARYLV